MIYLKIFDHQTYLKFMIMFAMTQKINILKNFIIRINITKKLKF